MKANTIFKHVILKENFQKPTRLIFHFFYFHTLIKAKNTSTRLEACNFIKIETLAQLLPFEFCEIFQNTFFHGTPPVAASVLYINIEINNLQYKYIAL